MPCLALSIVVPQPFPSHFLMRCQSSTNRPVEASLHNRNRQNKNKEQNRVLKREAVLKFQGKLMAGLGLLVQETSCAYKAGTYEKIGVGTWDKGTVSAILSSQNNILPRGQEASCRGETWHCCYALLWPFLLHKMLLAFNQLLKKKERDLREVFIAELGTRVSSAFGGKFAVALHLKQASFTNRSRFRAQEEVLAGAKEEIFTVCWSGHKDRSQAPESTEGKATSFRSWKPSVGIA